ncbi:MAG: PD-(D/E)XK nuclease family protein [bacterium]
MAIRRILKNEFSWSKSREQMFRECLRKYYYNYYLSWNGWESDCSPEVRKSYVLKQLKSRQIWAGEIIHSCIDHSLKNLQNNIPVMELDKIKTLTLDAMRIQFRSSKSKNYWQSPKSLGLLEHEYNETVTDSEWKELSEHVQACLDTFYAGKVFKRLINLKKEDWLEIEQFSNYIINDVKIWAVMDCCFRDKTNIIIMDWKTGKNLDNNSMQLMCYASYAIRKWNKLPEEINVYEYSLSHDLLKEYSVSEAGINEVENLIMGSLTDMYSLLEDPGNNTPKSQDKFIRTEKISVCKRCNFKGICRPEIVNN